MALVIGGTLICLDVGNTSVTYGIHDKRRFSLIGRARTYDSPGLVNKLLRKSYLSPSIDIVLSSVVPKITHSIKRMANKFGLRNRLWIVNENLKVPIKHHYQRGNKLGADRLVVAYGAAKIYGAPLLIFDYGTAVTCDYLSDKGVFLGGMIIPGAEISFQALYEKTALLPQLGFPGAMSRSRMPQVSLIGRDTKSCMKAGILYGYGAMTDGLVDQFRHRYGNRFRVIATGGFARTLAPYVTKVDILDPILPLKSLVRLYLDQIKKAT